jgi:hypothetical protein
MSFTCIEPTAAPAQRRATVARHAACTRSRPFCSISSLAVTVREVLGEHGPTRGAPLGHDGSGDSSSHGAGCSRQRQIGPRLGRVDRSLCAATADSDTNINTVFSITSEKCVPWHVPARPRTYQRPSDAPRGGGAYRRPDVPAGCGTTQPLRYEPADPGMNRPAGTSRPAEARTGRGGASCLRWDVPARGTSEGRREAPARLVRTGAGRCAPRGRCVPAAAATCRAARREIDYY